MLFCFFSHGISCKRHVQFIENVNMVKGDQESEDCISAKMVT